jgi:cytochrome c
MDHSSVPAEARAILTAKCADCHSTQTHVPLYGRLAPASWLMERDILRGRAAMNLSQWDTYSPVQQQTFAAKIVEETKAHEMPLPQYRMIHRSARITDADIQTLSNWARATADVETGSSNEPATASDPIRGKEVYEKRCTGCHAITSDRDGPRLQSVYGRTSGTVPGFDYSPALKQAHIVWNEASLEKWLTDPDTLVPGNNMEFHVPKPQERRDLIRFLKEGAATNATR